MHIGFIGTGLMGNPMCHRLLKQGYRLSVWNRTRNKLRDLEKAGAISERLRRSHKFSSC